ncbi:hypothetical protein H8E88_03260 [candidate division KSB1 bacterium]|nr:hypothetical protein [candidate division KSB1 bacterium]
MKDNTKVNLALLLFTVFVPLYTLETYLEFKIKFPVTIIQKKAEQMSLPFDARTQMEVLSDLRQDGIDAYPAIAPRFILDTNVNGLKTNGKMFFPLGSISNKTTTACNEWGYRLIYESDEHGFNNPKNLYKINGTDIVLTGDSYTDGFCVKPDENIGAVLRNSGFNTISVGKAGNGSLLEFAALKEYAEPIKPKIVLWLYFENDLDDLQIEMKSSLLMQYLLEDGFTQNLISNQKQIDSVLTSYVKGMEQDWNQREKTEVLHSRPTRMLKLTNIRGKISLASKPKPDIPVSTIDVFKAISDKSKKMVSKWNGRLYFVYLPVFYRYSMDKGNSSILGMKYRDRVLNIARKLDIPIIDIHKEVFASHPDPLSLFPFRTFGHYNAEGYRLVAEAIAKRLHEDNFIPTSQNL